MNILVSAAIYLSILQQSLLPVRAARFFPGPDACAILPQERIRGGGDKPAALETARKLESWVEISESVSRLCTFDAGNTGGGISVILLLFLCSPLAFLRFKGRDVLFSFL
jgi:hypothetical protein